MRTKTQPNKMADPEKAMEVENDHEDIEEDDDEVADGTNAKATMAAELLKNPAKFAALQGKLNSMVGMNSGYIASLPAPVKRRLKSLKKIQLESTKIEAKFYEEVHKLECKYHEMYKPLYDQKAKKEKDEKETKGVPEFWLTIFKNVDMLQEMVQEHDEPVLAALTDVKVTFSDGFSEA